MIRRPPRSTRTDTLFPYTTLFRSTTRMIRGPYALHAPLRLVFDHARRLRDWRDLHRAQRAGAADPRVTPLRRSLALRAVAALAVRSEERRGGKECGRTCRSRWWPDDKKINQERYKTNKPNYKT